MSKQSKILFFFSGFSLLGLAVVQFILGTWMPFMWGLVGLFVIMLIGGLWFDRHLYKEFFSMKTTKQGMSMGTLILLMLILLVAINFISARKYKTFDFSAAQVNTLSEQSVSLLKSLAEDLKVIYFYQKDSQGVEENKRAFMDLLRKYQDQSPLVKLDFVDINERPDLAEAYGVTQPGLVYVEYKGRKSKIEKIDEQELTGAIVKATREKDKIVYFTMGHGEGDIEDANAGLGLNALKKLLEGHRYLVKSVNLNQTPEVPKEADLVFIAGPRQAFADLEVKALQSYLRKGGSVVMALKSQSPHGLKALLNDAGVSLKDNFVVQIMNTPMGRAINPSATPVTDFSTSQAITKPFGSGQFVVMRLPSAIKKIEPVKAGLVVEELLKTNTNSMAFADKNFQGGKGENGPFILGTISKGKLDEASAESTLVVFGDADFLSNQLLYQNLNRDLALNTVSFLAKEENIISISPKEVGVTQLEVTDTKLAIYVWGLRILLPLALLIASGSMWYRRRYA